MDYKFLDKVVEQIVSETRIDYNTQEGDDEGRIYTPFQKPFLISLLYFLLVSFKTFYRHCEEVYGLNYDETEYVWKEYKEIIRVKIENNGL
jgi:hypothetical protein